VTVLTTRPPYVPDPSAPYRAVLSTLATASETLAPAADMTDPMAPLVPEHIRLLGQTLDALTEHVAAVRMHMFQAAPADGQIVRQMLFKAADHMGAAGILIAKIGDISTLKADEMPEIETEPAAPALEGGPDQWLPLALSTREALKALGWVYPDCFPGESDACGEDGITHVAVNLAMLRAVGEFFSDHMPPEMFNTMNKAHQEISLELKGVDGTTKGHPSAA
jgi:hypothetical protein